MNRLIRSTDRLSSGNLGNGNTKRRAMRLLPRKGGSRLASGGRSRLSRRNWRDADRRLEEKIRSGIKRLREEMAEISEEQKCIRVGQTQAREKYERIKADREQLWKEMELISKQNAAIQMRLGLMSGLVKAMALNDSDLAAQLTRSLRDLVAKQDEQVD